MKKILLVCLLGSLSACVSAFAPEVRTEAEALRDGQYRLDPAHATLLFKIRHLGISTYVGRFNSFDATLDFAENQPDGARLDAVIDVSSLDVNNQPFEKTLRGPNWFNADAFPKARFTATAVEVTGENTGIARGELTIRGVTKPFDLNIEFHGGVQNILNGAYTIGFTADGTFDRKDFGIDRFQGFVGDQVRIEFYGEFKRQTA